MKNKIFAVITIILIVVSFCFLGLAIYSLHRAIWESAGIFVIVAILVTIFACSSMSIALMFFNFANPRKGLRMGVNIALPGIVVGGLATSFFVERAAFRNYISFTPEKWQSIDSRYKLDMTSDFLDKYDVKEMTVNQVVDLLGEPYSEGKVIGSSEYNYQYSYDCGVPINASTSDPYILKFYTLGIADKDAMIVAYSLRQS